LCSGREGKGRDRLLMENWERGSSASERKLEQGREISPRLKGGSQGKEEIDIAKAFAGVNGTGTSKLFTREGET